jgi:hypothetical protein
MTFTGGALPPPVSGIYRVTWLGKSTYDAGAVELVSASLNVVIPEDEPAG